VRAEHAKRGRRVKIPGSKHRSLQNAELVFSQHMNDPTHATTDMATALHAKTKDSHAFTTSPRSFVTVCTRTCFDSVLPHAIKRIKKSKIVN